MLGTACGREHPGAGEKRRLMAHMLSMAAGQVSHPITVLVHMKSDDRLIHTYLIWIAPAVSIRNTTFSCNSATLC